MKLVVDRWRRLARRLPGLASCIRGCRLVLDAGYRAERALMADRPPRLFQPYGHTAHDRYPAIFEFVAGRLAGVPEPRLLSFGCSTGEEVFTLRRYFPRADITGIDINARSIAVCRRRLSRRRDSRIRFEVADSALAQPSSHYDAVFCMAVLRHGDLGRDDSQCCEHLIRFADFEAVIADLSRCLKSGGLLAVRGSNFRLSDTAVAGSFEVVLELAGGHRADTPLFGRDNLRLPETPYNEVVFRKRATP